MKRDVQAPLTPELFYNLLDLLPRLNLIRFQYGKPLKVSSGYRPAAFNANAGGAARSNHLRCQAVDFADPNGEFGSWCLSNLELLERAGLWLEDPAATQGWIHLQSVAPASGAKVQMWNDSNR